MSVTRSARRESPSLSAATVSAFSARGIGAAVMLAAQIEIARRLGPTGAGRVATGLTAVAVLAVLGRYGSDQLIMRRVAVRTDRRLVGLDYAAAARLSLPLLCAAGALLFLLATPLADLVFHDAPTATTLRWLAPSLPAFGLVSVQGEAIKGLGHPVAGSALQSLVGPVVTLGLLFILRSTTSLAAISATISIGFMVSAVAAHVAWKILSGPRDTSRAVDTLGFVREAGPFFGTSIFALALTYAPVLALATLGDPADVGRYFAADRWTQIPAMMLVAVNAVVGPRFAVMWVQRRHSDIRHLLVRTTVGSAAVAALVAAVLVVGAPWLLGLFGEGYESAVPALRILAVAQFVVLACGPVTALLVMSGGERGQRVAAGAAAVMVFSLCVVLVPTGGLWGAAVAGAVATLLNKGLIIWMLRSTVRDDTHVAGSRTN